MVDYYVTCNNEMENFEIIIVLLQLSLWVGEKYSE